MKRPTPASLKKVTPENLARLGVERLAEILASVADTRPELKRRLRMELAAEQGAEHLVVEIDRRLATLETSRSRVSWRQRGAFVRDLETLRGLIAGRLTGLDRAAARARLLTFLGLVPRVRNRVKDRDGELAAVFERAAADLVRTADEDPAALVGAWTDSIAQQPLDWSSWLIAALAEAPPQLAGDVLRRLSARSDATQAWVRPLRLLADAAGDLDAWRATFTANELAAPAAAAALARRLLAADRPAEAEQVLTRAAPAPAGLGRRVAPPDPEWEEAWIDMLEQSGRGEAAQAARWAAFQRTLSVEQARAFCSRLSGFEDVEAAQRAFDHAAAFPDFARGLAFLMTWPALPEAAAMIQARGQEGGLDPELAELWAGRLRARFPAAANRLLRGAAAAAFRRREYATADRLTAEADSLPLADHSS